MDEKEILDDNREEGHQRWSGVEEVCAVGLHVPRGVHELRERVILGDQLAGYFLF